MIINTPGWTKGTGLELLISLIDLSKPDIIIILSGPGNDTLANSLYPIAKECQSHLLPLEPASSVAPQVQLTAAELRALGIMSYFHRIGVEKWDFGTHLTTWKPWVVKFAGTVEERGLLAFAIQGGELLLEDIVLAINGTMVAIIILQGMETQIEFTAEGLPVLSGRENSFMDPTTARCEAYAVVRGINVAKGELMLLSPWDPSNLAEGEQVVLERGHVNVPIWGMWDLKNARVLGPYLQRQ
jgi:polynucleotide 5'-hydroxyl-kinase GRC3/NOL9